MVVRHHRAIAPCGVAVTTRQECCLIESAPGAAAADTHPLLDLHTQTQPRGDVCGRPFTLGEQTIGTFRGAIGRLVVCGKGGEESPVKS